MSAPTRIGLQLHSTVQSSGELTLSLAQVEAPAPGPNEVLVRVEAAPINPSDLWLMLAGADLGGAVASGSAREPVLTARVPEANLRGMTSRFGVPMPVGNEGAGTVVEAGQSPAAQALLGKKVAMLGGAMFSQLRTVALEQCLALPDDVTAAEGASAFVNPLTALTMLETMRREQHTALVHTAAASNLGQMLVKLCAEEKVELVNVVRKPEQIDLLRGLGAKHVVSSEAPGFMKELIARVAETGATLAFDAVGGGKLANQLLTAMEAAASAKQTQYSRYGSSTHKQVYIYGNLDRGPTELSRSFGLAWSVGGWLVTSYLQKLGGATAKAMRERVVRGLKTTFASRYAATVSLTEALSPESIARYAVATTGKKYLLTPNPA
ncbi:MAG: zinc-binding dehydrogenase [Archangiaceae bacterium]|nr:zinc-binding dehydrogenase [Archangiaceae bacterium]